LRVLASVARPTQGSVSVFGHSTAGDADEVRRRVGLLSHRSFLNGELTAVENLEFAATMYGLRLPPAALLAALEAVGLAHAAHARLRGFSQGMAQRLALARAMLHRPGLLLLDEPYSALDAAGLDLLDRQLAEFHSQGGTLILVTHQIERGLAICRRAVALAGGRITFDGTTEAFRATAEARAAGDWGTS
jgi:heme exporter protein A